ncbi:mechanosensitive ion channel family protein [Terricaulis sp.]|uniref:mechanosensitive ion channel family protein n=1 Tax=Terricaulis sp. TaxID=2768686 RepID=UPI003784187B
MFVTTPPQTPAPRFSELVQSFLNGLLALDPTQAAIRGGLSILVFIGAALLIWGIRLVLKTLSERLIPADPNAPPRKRTGIGRWSMRIARIAIVLAALLIVLRVWGFDLATLSKGPVGAVLAAAGHIALIIVLALVAIEIASLAINQVFTRIAKRSKNARRASQLRTLAPVLTGVTTTTFVVIATMMTLSEVGVEIGPLLAGAGIVGLAVGFGAQTIVKDFLTGIFLILEDTVSIGDAVKIGEFGGVVEDMSLRTIKLRDYDGTLHVFPYSEAQVIHNSTKGFSYYVFELTISKSDDIERATVLMREVGDVVCKDPRFAGVALAPLEIAGVDKISDAGIVLKGRIRTAPGQQWALGREFLRRIKIAFDEGGVETPTAMLKMVAMQSPPGAS